MSEIVHVYRCPLDHHEIEVIISRQYDCPLCGTRMRYVTSRKRS